MVVRTPWSDKILALPRPELMRFRMLVERGISSPLYRQTFRDEYEKLHGPISEELLLHHLHGIRRDIDEKLAL